MRSRQPFPRLILLTDERQGDGLWPALGRLPRGAGVVVRHHRLPPAARRAVFERVRAIARARGLVLLLAGEAGQAAGWRADGVMGVRAGRRTARPLHRLVPAHDPAELVAAARAGADAALLSPVFATRTHPGGRVLGPRRFGRLARGLAPPLILALGGMTGARARRLRPLGAAGWAAIDGLTGRRPPRT